jgi:NAD(P)-dependent dehydrogenase (short-subunit alcohol dehydrogenase family)
MKQVSIVTGGASGIGLALGTALVHRGWHVVLADLQDVAAKEHADRLTRTGPGSAVGVHVDVRDAGAVAQLVESTHDEHGQLDLMVNNAGIAIGGEPEELELVHWDAIIDTNLRGVIHGCHAAYPVMLRQGNGQILNVASAAGLIPSPGQMAPYAATKFGVVGLSHSLRAAGADRGTRVSVLCPGWIDTPLLDDAWPEDLPIPPSMASSPSMREGLVQAGVQIYPADRLAEDALLGLERNKAVLVIPSEMHRAWLLFRLVPGLVEGKALARPGRHARRSDSEQRLRRPNSPREPPRTPSARGASRQVVPAETRLARVPHIAARRARPPVLTAWRLRCPRWW